mmetsp:Transcript_58050/g.92236  ORF Transcript_58050/g.92236 Transcript_58050/m.92236 type:complete len:218 (+) Transcript_58050:51-704(+)|eukprot:CAMPEP_0169118878 /NCGR_PEP_ID=MMETSP1015-20121227/31238_1 /TAXON_ID=342587 /ORGANISM="Karlodinium micrum, Strain CCMP2283" /LENGTH=217 /DNA_ID=CAMNT_0009181681 /DNA_START=51 /DNA_END=704 /DNA_ORIENTATION=+
MGDVGWFQLFTGKFADRYPTHAKMLICGFAFLGSVSFSIVLFDAAYAMAISLLTLGVLYLVLPHDFLPDDWKIDIRGWNMPVGKIDDLLFGGGGIVGGICLWLGAYAKDPISFSPSVVVFFVVVLVMVGMAYYNENHRFLFVGIWAMFAQWAFFVQFITDVTVAIGVGTYCFGFIYNALPQDLLPTTVFGSFGEVDNYFASLCCILGAMLTIYGVLT